VSIDPAESSRILGLKRQQCEQQINSSQTIISSQANQTGKVSLTRYGLSFLQLL